MRHREDFATVVAAIAVGAILRLWQYVANPALWSDEIALAAGIVNLDLQSLLTGPLPANQVAPKGFLLAEKLIVMALGPSDYALRAFPVICALVALLAFRSLAIRVLDGIGPLVATVLFATAAPLVAFGSVVKQYSTDVCVAVLLSRLAYDVMSDAVIPRRAALIGAVLVWLSQPSVLMVAGLGACLIVCRATLRPNGGLAAVLTAWGTSAVAVTAVSFASMSTVTREYVHRFWAPGFPPEPPSRVLETFWPLDQVVLLFGRGTPAGLAYPLPALYGVLAVVGVGVLWVRNRRAALLLVGPILVALGAAVARQYPFTDRLVLFLVPSFLLAIAAAIDGLHRLVKPKSRLVAAGVAAGLLAPTVYPVAATPPAYRIEDMKAVLSYVQARRQPMDGIYVYYGAAPAMTFYASQYGFARRDYAVGGCHRGDGRRYLRELDTFRGQSRVWVLLTHAIPHYREREDILAYLDAIGTRQDELVVESRAVAWKPLPAEVFLYDLRADPSAASAESFPLRGPSSADATLGCRVGPHALVAPDFG